MAAMADLFEQMVDLDRLNEGWWKVWGNRGGPGGDGETLRAFRVGALERLTRLARDVRGGTYRPGPYRHLGIPKRSGGLRGLSIPCVVDRVLMTAAALVLSPVLEPEFAEASHGYRPGRGVASAVRRVELLRDEGYGWVVDGDIVRYFDSVPHDRLLARFDSMVGDARLTELLALWLHSYDPRGLGLPQGAPISPLLANLYLDAVDARIESRGVRLVRFADDFVLLCRNEAAAEGARAELAALLEQEGLQLHPDKTRIVPFAQGFTFLGQIFVRAMVMPAPQAEAPADDMAGAVPLDGPGGVPITGVPEDDPAALLPGPFGDPPFSGTLYVLEPGRVVSTRNEALCVLDQGRELLAIPPERIERIELGVGVVADSAALRHAAQWGVPVALLDGRGGLLAWLTPADGGLRGAVHLAQARHVLDPALRLALARSVVGGRLQTQFALLKRLNRRRKDALVARACDGLKRVRRKLAAAADIPALMGLEGEGAALYWPALGNCLEQGWRLPRRQRREAADPVNLVLDWLASLLHRELCALIDRQGLDGGMPVLHSPRRNHAGLASDLMEGFRAPLAEACAVYLFNNTILKHEDFVPAEGGGWRVGAAGARALIRTWEAWLTRPVQDAQGIRRPWRGLLAQAVVDWQKHVCGQGVFNPYAMDY
jgi:CRISP-associated protein Cas1